MPSAGHGNQTSKNCPLPWGEGDPRPALSSAGAGRVRGHSCRGAKSLCRIKSSQHSCTPLVGIPCKSRRPHEAEERHRLCCPVEGWRRNLAARGAWKAGLSISAASSLDKRSGLIAVFIVREAERGKMPRKTVVIWAGVIPPRRATDPSPVPLRLMKAPDAGHPLPKGEGRDAIHRFSRALTPVRSIGV
jgi:hypothetical protein